MPYKKLLITGTFRSGTNLLPQAFNAHENISCASVAFFDFFKHLRNKYYSQKIKGFDPQSPLSDKFLSDPQIDNGFLDNFLRIELDQTDLEIIIPKIIKAVKPWSPKLVPFLEKMLLSLEKKTNHKKKAQAVLDDLMQLIKQAYPKKNLQIVGFKKTWLEEFIKPLLKLPHFYCLHIIRDPRAVIASNKKIIDGEKFPFLYVIRQWRKSVAYSIINQANKHYCRIKFENLITYPKQGFQNITKFLGIPFSKHLIDFDKFKDDKGKQWLSNSSFQQSKGFDQAAINRWKNVLSKEEIALVELLCEPEMRYLGYQLLNSKPDYGLLFNYQEDRTGWVGWIKKYSYAFTKQRAQEELARIALLKTPAIFKDDPILDRFFITKQVYCRLQNNDKNIEK